MEHDYITAMFNHLDSPADLDRQLARAIRSLTHPALEEYDPADNELQQTRALAQGYGRARIAGKYVEAYEARLAALNGARMKEGARRLDEYRKTRDTLDGAIARHPAGTRLP